MKKFNRRAHSANLILEQVGVGQRCRAFDVDVESPAKLPTMSTPDVPAGPWMKVQGKIKRRAHRFSSIGIHVGVGQGRRAFDVESPAKLPTMNTRVTFQPGNG